MNIIKIAAVILLFYSCSAKVEDMTENTENKLKESISIDGSSTVYPITEAVAEEIIFYIEAKILRHQEQK